MLLCLENSTVDFRLIPKHLPNFSVACHCKMTITLSKYRMELVQRMQTAFLASSGLILLDKTGLDEMGVDEMGINHSRVCVGTNCY